MMSRCRQTDHLLDATFAGAPLEPAAAAHARECGECVRALAWARRFETELAATVKELAPEPMPPLASLGSRDLAGGARPMTRPRRLIATSLAAATVAVALVAGVRSLAPATFAPSAGGGTPEQQVSAWLERAIVIAVDTGGRNEDAANWEPYQVEVCASHVIAFFVDRDASSVRPLRWAIGRTDAPGTVTAAGIAGSLMDADVARARAELPLCTMFIDPSLDQAAAEAAVLQAQERWEAADVVRRPATADFRGSALVDMAPMTRELYTVLLARPETVGTWLARITLWRADDGSFWIQHSSSEESANAEDGVVYRDAAPTHYFMLIDDPAAVAVELAGAEDRLRYSVGAPGFVLEGVAPRGQLDTFRLLAWDRRTVAEGQIAPWPPEQ